MHGAAAVVDATEEQLCALRQFVLWKNFAQILQGVGRHTCVKVRLQEVHRDFEEAESLYWFIILVNVSL